MTTKKTCCLCAAMLLLFWFLAAQVCFSAAYAYDAELLKDLPGEWILPVDVQPEAEDAHLEDLAFLTLKEDGSVALRCYNRDGIYAYSCNGAWAFEYLPDDMDQLTLWFTSTDDPDQEGVAYDLKCVYDIYAESWVENDTEITYLIFSPSSISGISPFKDLYGDDDPGFYRKVGPNMRVVNCKEYVSLREKRSISSKRLAKVPLGALVLAYPEYGAENGFIQCVYHDEYGYILAEYLEPVIVNSAEGEPAGEVQQMLMEMDFADAASGQEAEAIQNAQRYLGLPETGAVDDVFQIRLYDLYATATGMMEGDGLDPEELREIYPLYCSWEGENEWGGVFCYRHLEEERVTTQLAVGNPPGKLEQMLTRRLCDLWERDILAMYDEWAISLPKKDRRIAQEQKAIFETSLQAYRQEWKSAEDPLMREATWLEAQGIDLCFDLHGMEGNE